MSEVTTPTAWEWPNTPGQWPSNHRRNAVGHQGLFFDRLEATGPATTDGLGAGGRQLVAEAWPSVGGTTPTASSPRGLYQNRNRTLDPVLGRFLQRDPNASGVVVSPGVWKWGVPPLIGVAMFDAEARLTDGSALHQYLRSNVFSGTDPTGLYISPLDTFSIGMEVLIKLRGMLEGAAAWQEMDAASALDWSVSDDYFGAGAYGGGGIADDTIEGDDGQLMASTRVVTLVTRGAKMIRTGQLHHVLPKYLRKVTNVSSDALVRLPARKGDNLHRKYHTALDNALRGPPLRMPSMHANQKAWKKWMKDNVEGNSGRDWGENVKKQIIKVTKQFQKDHNLGNEFVDAIEAAWKAAKAAD